MSIASLRGRLFPSSALRPALCYDTGWSFQPIWARRRTTIAPELDPLDPSLAKAVAGHLATIQEGLAKVPLPPFAEPFFLPRLMQLNPPQTESAP